MTITLGADPEIFFSNGKEHISAIGLIGGSKHKPVVINGGYAVLEDNVAAEFNIPPSDSFGGFNNALTIGLGHIEGYAKRAHLICSVAASASFSESQLQSDASKEFGCEPDYNAWTGEENSRPTATDSSLRSCGGHVHVGGVIDINPLGLVRAMDLFLGVPSIILDQDTERRKLYGKAGAFRMKEYGVEYRTLSNFWIFSTDLRAWVWNSTMQAIEFAKKTFISEDSAIGKLIQHTINESDEDGYKGLLMEFPEINVHAAMNGVAA